MIQLILLQILLSFSVTDSLTSNATDQHALLSFKQAFIYDPYNNLQSWNNGISLCKWTGVECSSWNQRVIGVNISEYGFGSTPSIKGDVYSFGILLLEMMTRKRPTDRMFVEGLNLPKWVRMAFPDRIGEVMDTSLLRGENIDALEQHEILNCVNQLAALGLVCTRESPEERPTMTEVVTVLERIRKTVVGDSRHLGLQIAIRFNI